VGDSVGKKIVGATYSMIVDHIPGNWISGSDQTLAPKPGRLS
jgi:hypothetical protein